MTEKPKRPRDANQLAKVIADMATGLLPRDRDLAKAHSPETERGRLGGLKGGRSRAEALSAEQRSEIARRAAAARWKDDGGDSNS